jgi:hypothetical protein
VRFIDLYGLEEHRKALREPARLARDHAARDRVCDLVCLQTPLVAVGCHSGQLDQRLTEHIVVRVMRFAPDSVVLVRVVLIEIAKCDHQDVALIGDALERGRDDHLAQVLHLRDEIASAVRRRVGPHGEMRAGQLDPGRSALRWQRQHGRTAAAEQRTDREPPTHDDRRSAAHGASV